MPTGVKTFAFGIKLHLNKILYKRAQNSREILTISLLDRCCKIFCTYSNTERLNDMPKITSKQVQEPDVSPGQLLCDG